MRYIIMEVGSTNTKSSLYDNGKIKDLGFCTIEFKNNYKQNNKIIDSDKEKLYTYIDNIREIDETIYVYGTSIFRNLKDSEKQKWLKEFKLKTGLEFNIVSSEKENEYTVYGACNIDYNGKIAVMIGGGGSTELAIVLNKKIIETINYDFGAMDITDKYPDLRMDKAITPFDKMLEETLQGMKKPNNKADLLILAGGDYIMFYETLKYPVSKNKLYRNKLQPYILDIKSMDKLDQDFLYEQSLEKIINDNGNDGWWRGARGMRICVKSITKLLDTKYIIPTRINMLYGIIEEINNSFDKE